MCCCVYERTVYKGEKDAFYIEICCMYCHRTYTGRELCSLRWCGCRDVVFGGNGFGGDGVGTSAMANVDDDDDDVDVVAKAAAVVVSREERSRGDI